MTPNVPDWIGGGGWQLDDEEHPAGEGESAYRVVYKTLRVVLMPVEISGNGLWVKFRHGTVDRGGAIAERALRAHRDRWVLPETGVMVPDGDGFLRYEPRINMHWDFKPLQDTIDDVFFVEFVVTTDSSEPEEQLREGREHLALPKTTLDLKLGQRVLGLMLTEEVGEVFPDGHFNRWLVFPATGAESQLDVEAVEKEPVIRWNEELSQLMDKPVEERRRLQLGCEWYWAAIHADDPVTEYLHLWFVVEAVTMPKDRSDQQVRKFLADRLGGKPQDWRETVRLHSDRRGGIVHGNRRRRIELEAVAELRDLVEGILEMELGSLHPERRRRLLGRAGLI